MRRLASFLLKGVHTQVGSAVMSSILARSVLAFGDADVSRN
jgi:hypothetical protein